MTPPTPPPYPITKYPPVFPCELLKTKPILQAEPVWLSFEKRPDIFVDDEALVEAGSYTHWRPFKPTVPEPVKEETLGGDVNAAQYRTTSLATKQGTSDTVMPLISSDPTSAATSPQAQGTATPRTDAVWRKTKPLDWPQSFKEMHDHAEALERELAAKDEEIQFLSTDDPSAKRLLELQSAHAATLAQLEAAKKDTKRLEWIFSTLSTSGTDGFNNIVRWGLPGIDRRDIDYAMQAKK